MSSIDSILFILNIPILNTPILFKKNRLLEWALTTEFAMYQNFEVGSWDHVQKTSCKPPACLPSLTFGFSQCGHRDGSTRTVPGASPWSWVSSEHPEGPMPPLHTHGSPGRAVTLYKVSTELLHPWIPSILSVPKGSLSSQVLLGGSGYEIKLSRQHTCLGT